MPPIRCLFVILLLRAADSFSPTTPNNKSFRPIRHHQPYRPGGEDNRVVTSGSPLLLASTPTDDEYRVLEAIDELFPPQGLDQRIALSRKDGYWPFVSSGDEPPQELVYGEFDTAFFARILQRAGEIMTNENENNNNPHRSSSLFEDSVFCDLGSGTGRLVLTAAALFPWKLCRGIELLEGIHEQAVEKLEACRQSSPPLDTTAENDGEETIQASESSTTTSSAFDSAYWKQYQQYSPTDNWLNNISASFDEDTNDCTTSQEEDGATTTTQEEISAIQTTTTTSTIDPIPQEEEDAPTNYCALTHSASGQSRLPLAPMDLQCGSFTDPYEFYADANLVFVYSSAMPYHILVDLARAVGRQCQPGTLVITTEYQLPLGGTIEPCEDDPTLPHGEYQLELLETMTGENESTGGLSTIYIQRLVRSIGDGIRRSPPILPVSEIAYRVIQKLMLMEQGKLKNNPQQLFLRNVSNQMIFLGLPESWRPKSLLDDNDDDSDNDDTDDDDEY
jgi:hypothetical protein